ncbi:tetratricopeptide repeat protein [Streptomyces chartreusis]
MCTLPRTVPYFTGRKAELERLIEAATSDRFSTIQTIDGMAGVGKTALAVHGAHLLAQHFPDGQLFIPLRAHTPGQALSNPEEVLASLLASTGMAPHEIPSGLDERAERWRDWLANRRMVLVLDDAHGHSQVEPFMPGNDLCHVLITSRRRLLALDGSTPLSLEVLPSGSAAQLLNRLAHRDPQAYDARAATELVSLCGFLPLAISLVAGRLAHHPTWSFTSLAAELSSAKDNLRELAAGNRAVAAAFELSYAGLCDRRRTLFRRLGLHFGGEFDAHAAAALGDISLAEAQHDLEALYIDHLIDERTPHRYQMHDLVRDYARTLATKELTEVRTKATERLLDYYQRTSEAANQHLTRHTRPRSKPATLGNNSPLTFPDRDQALSWLLTERLNLCAAIEFAASRDLHQRTVSLSEAIATFLRQVGPWQEAASLHEQAVEAARRGGDRTSEANALGDLGRVRYLSGDSAGAAKLHQMALALYRELGNRLGEANSLNDLGDVRYLSEDYRQATTTLTQALTLYRGLQNRLGEANTLTDLGRVLRLVGDYDEATDALTQALALSRDLDSQLGEANSLIELGTMHYLRGNYEDSLRSHDQALAIYRSIGDRNGVASSLNGLGRVACQQGNYKQADELLMQALTMYRLLGSRHGEASSLCDLGRLHTLNMKLQEAEDLLIRALEIFKTLGDLLGEAEVLNTFGALLVQSGDKERANAVYGKALTLALQVGSPLETARAMAGIDSF